ncbi:MAG: outer membrane lipoprotein carrier protein LolA [Candidatus Thiodiazotropha sp. (ex Monitilora ramsayi)]|nr:outer membrane lipoprotein carrier protein LolA [Candidatus Thiodiazotropha sp. (ex Monitilora ramsayi)]
MRMESGYTLRTALLLLSLFMTASIQAEATDWTLAQLMLKFTETGQRENRFTEIRELSLLNHSLESKGTLTFTPPDRLSKQFDPPDGLGYGIEGNRLTIRKSDGSIETLLLDHSPRLLAYIASLRAVLAGDLPGLSVYFDTELKGSSADWQLTLLPREPKLSQQVSRIEITGQKADIRQFMVIEQGGDRITTRLHSQRED